MSKRDLKLPKLKDLKKKRQSSESSSTRKGRAAGRLNVPDSVGETKEVKQKARREATTSTQPAPRSPRGRDGVVSTVALSRGDRRLRRVDVPESIREQYGLGRT